METKRDFLEEYIKLFLVAGYFEDSVSYCYEAIKYDSYIGASFLLEHNIKLENFDAVRYVYNRMKNFNYTTEVNPIENGIKSLNALTCFIRVFHFYKDAYRIEDARVVVKDCKDFINKFESRFGKTAILEMRDTIKVLEEQISEFERKEELSANVDISKINDNLISQYFEDKSRYESLPAIVKYYIFTSLDVFNHLSSSVYSMDYSASVMPMMKAVENMIYHIFGNRYLNYLKKKYYEGKISLNMAYNQMKEELKPDEEKVEVQEEVVKSEKTDQTPKPKKSQSEKPAVEKLNLKFNPEDFVLLKTAADDAKLSVSEYVMSLVMNSVKAVSVKRASVKESA